MQRHAVQALTTRAYRRFSFPPHGDSDLSAKDKNSNEIGDVELVIAISRKSKTTFWRHDNIKKELSGVLGDFKFQMAVHSCYNTRQKTRKFERIDLLCPFGVGIGPKNFDITIPFPALI